MITADCPCAASVPQATGRRWAWYGPRGVKDKSADVLTEAVACYAERYGNPAVVLAHVETIERVGAVAARLGVTLRVRGEREPLLPPGEFAIEVTR